VSADSMTHLAQSVPKACLRPKGMSKGSRELGLAFCSNLRDGAQHQSMIDDGSGRK
jgi:hypothetical protein